MKNAFYFNMTLKEVANHLQLKSLRQHYVDFCRDVLRKEASPDHLTINHYKVGREDVKNHLQSFTPSLEGKALLQVSWNYNGRDSTTLLDKWMCHLSTLGLVILDASSTFEMGVVHNGIRTTIQSYSSIYTDRDIIKVHVLQAFDKGIDAADNIACVSILDSARPLLPGEDFQIYLPSMMRDFEFRPVGEQLRCLAAIAWCLKVRNRHDEDAAYQERQAVRPVLRFVLPSLMASMAHITMESKDHPLAQERGVELVSEFLRLWRGNINVRLSSK